MANFGKHSYELTYIIRDENPLLSANRQIKSIKSTICLQMLLGLNTRTQNLLQELHAETKKENIN